MSYEIYFVHRDPGQSFEDALEETENASGGQQPGPLSADELEQWQRILPRARRLLGEIEVFEEEDAVELTHADSGIQLSLHSGEASITVAGAGRAARDDVELMSLVYKLAHVVEDESDLEGYDPQLEEPVSETRDADPLQPPARSRDSDEADGPATTAAGREAGPSDSDADPTFGSGPGRRWWEFWKP